MSSVGQALASTGPRVLRGFPVRPSLTTRHALPVEGLLVSTSLPSTLLIEKGFEPYDDIATTSTTSYLKLQFIKA